jgi:hypothetical protein
MRLPGVLFLPLAALLLPGCGGSAKRQPPPTKLTTGFWFWQGSATDITWPSEPLDVLFVHVGMIRNDRRIPDRHSPGANPSESWFVRGRLPEEVPAVKECWLVFRYEHQGMPGLPAAALLAQEVNRLLAEARERHLNVVGVQLDIDSPTAALPRYADFLREVRKGLPPGFGISITALLDWFRNGTAIAEVIEEVDEFVPQFYDVADADGYGGGSAIAARIDAKRWGPIFNRYQKRYRIGISTFGRARLVPRTQLPTQGYARVSFFGDLAPLDIAANPAFELQASRSEADELVLNYRVTSETKVSYNGFSPGDAVQFILATPASIRAAMESTKQLAGYFAGAVFFRWPSWSEALVMQPDEVLSAAGLAVRNQRRQISIRAADRRCAAVRCVDLYLENATPFAPQAMRYRIHSSTGLEYFLPEERMPVRMVGAAEMELSLPPYCGRARMYLGRAVTLKSAEYTVEVVQ